MKPFRSLRAVPLIGALVVLFAHLAVSLVVVNTNPSVGSDMRVYRIAVAATTEYTTYHGGESQALAAIQATVSEVNKIYEKEFAIRFQLVSGGEVVFTAAEGDNYTSGNRSLMLGENQTVLDNLIGSSNYDIGHVLGRVTSSQGGLAGRGVVGKSSSKARGVSETSSPDSTNVGFMGVLLHEIGHQFGARHTFNSESFGFCIGRRDGLAAFEPASGSTLMSYAGICNDGTGDDDLQDDADMYFHTASFAEINCYIQDTPAAAPNALTDEGNSIPTVNGGIDYQIPARTPFTLTAIGSDPDAANTLSFTWEQIDLASAPGGLPLTDNGFNPLFRSFLPSTDPGRTFPRYSDLLVNAINIGEVLPTTTRPLNFRVSVRDGSGGVSSDDVLLNVTAGSGFALTALDSAINLTGGAAQLITWELGGTDTAPISTSQVRILFSQDGGLTFPYELATTSNDGSHSITVPNVSTTQGRIRIEPVGNIYFDINDSNFTITPDPAAIGVTMTPSGGSLDLVERGIADTYTINLNTAPAGSVTIQAQADSQSVLSTDGVSFASVKSVTLTDVSPTTITVRARNDSTEEGPHLSVISHAAISSTSGDYPVSIPLSRVFANIEDDEWPSVIGVDWDYFTFGSTAPTQWTEFELNPVLNGAGTGWEPQSTSNIPRDDGTATIIDFSVQLDPAGYSRGRGTHGIDQASTIPKHHQSLEALGGFNNLTIPITVTWSDLVPGQDYGLWVFGFHNDTTFVNDVTITGASTTSFTQTLALDALSVNGTTGSNGNNLASFEEIIAADGSGEIEIRVAPGAGSARLSLAGFAIREISAPVLSGLEAWRNNQFTPAQLADTNVSGTFANPEADDYVNLYEYAFDLNPAAFDDSSAPTMTVIGSNATISYTWNTGKYDVCDVVSISTDMRTWTPLTRHVISNANNMETVEITFPWIDRAFTRLEVKPAP